jgi:S1-C subfamily serine protease
MRRPIPHSHRRLALAASVAALLAGCGSDDPEQQSRTTPATQADAKRAVVAVQGVYPPAGGRPGKKTEVTGVVFSARQGLALTANHAVEQAPTINVTLADGTVAHARVVARAQCHDLAVLKIFPRPPRLTQLEFADSAGAGVGTPVSTLTYLLPSAKDGGDAAFTRVQGAVSALDVEERFIPLPKTGPFIAHQTPLLASASGSPIVDARGRMLGINTLVAHPREPDVKGIEYALTSNYIRSRLRELRPGVGGALGGWESEHDACHATLEKLVGIGHTHEGADG